MRLHVLIGDREAAPSALLAALAADLPDPGALLEALLDAGSDDDPWDNYHARIVVLMRDLVQGDAADVLLPALLAALRRALAGRAWPAKRIALAAVAACAQALPDALNAALPRADLEALLLDGAHEAESHNARRHAITALSHLHTVTPAVVAAVLHAAGDVGYVQEDALQATANFRHLSAGFDAEESLAPLAEALAGPGAARAAIAARILAALGSAPAALAVPDLRARIAGRLSAALRHGAAGREVCLLSAGGGIEEKGPLSQALFAALVQVWGLPE